VTVRILVAEPLAASGADALRPAGEVESGAGWSRDQLLARIGEFDALVVRSATVVDAELLGRATGLRVIGRAGVGVDNVDVDEATRRGIVVCNAPESNAVSAAEHTIALMLALARNLPQAHAALIAGRWERAQHAGVEVADKTLGLIGFGRIGQLVATRARGLSMRVLAFDPFVTRERYRELGVAQAASVDEVLHHADVVSLHTPLTPETRHLIDEAAIAQMRPGARLVNAARGGLVDVDAVAAALKEGRLAGAAIDVFEQEPITSSPLFGLANVVVTPHLAASTREAQDRAGVIVAEQVVAALGGASPRHALNIPFVDDEEMAVLAPFLLLARKLGRLAFALAIGPIERIEVATAGQLAGRDTRLLTLEALAGAFAGVVEDVNIVNARAVAAEHGIEVREQRREGAADYTNLLAVTARNGDEVTVVGTTLGADGRAWLVGAYGHSVEVELAPRMLVVRNADVPGMVGRIGTALGEAGVNIANMNLSRTPGRDDALMVLSIDSDPPEELLDTLAAADGVIGRPRFIRLP